MEILLAFFVAVGILQLIYSADQKESGWLDNDEK